MDEQTKNIIKKTIGELLEKMGFSANVSLSETEEDSSVMCNITTGEDSHFLIGQYGMNLQAIQHLARLMVRRNVPEEKIRFILDVNSYRQQKNQSVIEQARNVAEEAIAQHRAVIMKPMSNYERRIVHLELVKKPDVSTESVDEGEDRKIVLKPADMIE